MKTMKQAWHAAAILLLVLAGHGGATAGGDVHYQVPAGERAQLNDMSSYLDRPLRAGDMAELADLLDGPDQAVGALAASLLYKNAPADHWELILERLAVRDYDLRDRGLYGRVLQEDLPGMIAAPENQEPSLVDNRLTLLVVFLHFRDSNQWIINGDQQVSLARVFHTAFLTKLLEGTKIDPLDTANAIDRATRTEMGY